MTYKEDASGSGPAAAKPPPFEEEKDITSVLVNNS